MAEGISIYSAAGKLTYSSASSTWMILAVIDIGAGVSGSTNVTINPAYTEFRVSVNPIDGTVAFGTNTKLPTVSYSNGTISYSTTGAPASVPTQASTIVLLGR